MARLRADSNVADFVRPTAPNPTPTARPAERKLLLTSVVDPWHLVWIRILGSVPLSNGSGCRYGRPKIIRILWNRMRIRNTGKSHKKSQNSKLEQGFFHYFCLMMEGSGDASVLVTNGSGSSRPKNIRIMRTRIHNTVSNRFFLQCPKKQSRKLNF